MAIVPPDGFVDAMLQLRPEQLYVYRSEPEISWRLHQLSTERSMFDHNQPIRLCVPEGVQITLQNFLPPNSIIVTTVMPDGSTEYAFSLTRAQSQVKGKIYLDNKGDHVWGLGPPPNLQPRIIMFQDKDDLNLFLFHEQFNTHDTRKGHKDRDPYMNLLDDLGHRYRALDPYRANWDAFQV
eukprot:TRINITY_DN11741_c0_g1_i1.p1 TRINITY_DN11741_c0_g1~~TRINITY_DN11741_c0_g1_i1.p1  ORF type:complete len:181 (+),score=16.13 TRINITY_DN11741_c0_g1_i1:166-708(+)